MTDYTKLPRLYTTHALKSEGTITLEDKQAHYLKNVLRRDIGAQLRVFNGADGEWLMEIIKLGKKAGEAKALEQIKKQRQDIAAAHLIFAPLKKNRQDMLIEKAVELGITDFHPIVSDRTEVRKLKTERLRGQIIEAAEQCERISLPTLHDLAPLERCLRKWDENIPLYAALERGTHPSLNDALNKGAAAFIIGPVGGFTDTEHDMINGLKSVKPISLGNAILRAETASILCLAAHKLIND